MVRKIWLASFLALVITAHAQTLSSVKLEPIQAKAGESVKITVEFEPSEVSNCALRVHFGDGQVQKYTVSKASDMPLVITRSYDKPGQYKVDIEPTTAGSTLKCLGKRTHAMLTVAAAPSAASVTATMPRATVTATPTTGLPSTPTAASTSSTATATSKPVLCPEGWTLAKPGQNAKTKAFSCSAKAGTKIPEPRLSCPGDLTYFENSKKGQLGCRV